MASHLSVASPGKTTHIPTKEDLLAKVRFISLMFKLSGISKYRQGNVQGVNQFEKQ